MPLNRLPITVPEYRPEGRTVTGRPRKQWITELVSLILGSGEETLSIYIICICT